MGKVKVKKSKQPDYSEMSVDKFFETAGTSDSDVAEETVKPAKEKKLKKKDKSLKTKTVDDVEETTKKSKKEKKSKKAKPSKDSDDENVTDDAKIHKKQLKKLEKIDPEFFKFLEQNDKKLLKFDVTDDEDEDDEAAADGSEDDQDGEMTHKPSDDLEVPSDEEDFVDESKELSDDDENSDEDDTDGVQKQITLKLLQKWQSELSGQKKRLDTIKNVIDAFNSALASIAGGDNPEGKYRVEGSAIFNGIIQLCVIHLKSAIFYYLNIDKKSKMAPHKSKRWPKVRVPLKNYFIDLTKLLENIASGNIMTVLLKHLHQMAPLIPSFGIQVAKPVFKRLIALWSTGEETVRIIAFLCILRLTRLQQVQYLSISLKTMYIAYVRNSKFVSPSTLAAINFMRRSLVEMFALDLNVTYQHSFLYIRQLAIHLRNAITLKKKDSYQSVLNWQFINSLRLWGDLLSFTYNRAQLQPLIYPLVSIITGTIKLIPTAQYFPLRFHCVKILVRLSKETNVFVPVLPYLIEVLNSSIFGDKKSKQALMKPIQFTSILRASKNEFGSNVFRDEVIENVHGLMLEYMAAESYRISFPDMALLARTSIRKFMKTCKHPNYNRKLKLLCDKIDENSTFIENERNKVSFALNETKAIESWETTVRVQGTPLGIFYESWEKTNMLKMKRQALSSDDINDYKLPTINRKMFEGRPGKSSDGPVELFPDDSDEEGIEFDDSDEDGEVVVEKALKKDAKKAMKVVESPEVEEEEMEVDDEDDFIDSAGKDIDIVKDLDLDDWN